MTSNGEVVYCSCLGSDVVHEYSTTSEQWRTLPPCPVAGFGLAVVAGCLALVGGEETRLWLEERRRGERLRGPYGKAGDNKQEKKYYIYPSTKKEQFKNSIYSSLQ